MSADEFNADAIVDGDRAVLILEGEFDYGVQQRACDALGRMEHPRTLVVDLRGLAFMDSSGVHLLLDARTRCRKLLVMRGSAAVQRPLAALDLEREFEFVDEPPLVP